MMVLLSWIMGCTGPVENGDPPPVDEPASEPVAAKVLHRLNRAELDNAFRDRLGTREPRPSEALPADEIPDGLDNMAASLTVSVAHMAGLELAVDEAFGEYFGRDLEQTVDYPTVSGVDAGVQYFGEGSIASDVIDEGSLEIIQPTDFDGTFRLDSRLYADVGSASVEILVDNRIIDSVDVDWARGPDAPTARGAFVDLMVLALQCDLTRVIPFLSSPTSGQATYPFRGIDSGHHTLSHGFVSGSNNGATLNLMAIQRWHTAVFAGLAQRLAAIPVGESDDLLSKTLMVLASEFSDPAWHSAWPQPFVIAGGEAGGVRQGRVHANPVGTPHSNLLRVMIAFTGANPGDFGPTSTGTSELS